MRHGSQASGIPAGRDDGLLNEHLCSSPSRMVTCDRSPRTLTGHVNQLVGERSCFQCLPWGFP